MEAKHSATVDIPIDLLEMIRSFPSEREVEHCGTRFRVSPFDFYAVCPQCATRIKLRGYSATTEVEDIFDAIIEWMNRPETIPHVARRRQELANDDDS